MPRAPVARSFSLLLLVVVSAAGGALLDRLYVGETYKRQLSGELTQAERETQRFNPTLGLAEATLMTPAKLQEKYQAQRTEKDKPLEKFLAERGFVPSSISTSTFQHKTTERTGHGRMEKPKRPVVGMLVLPGREPVNPGIQQAMVDKGSPKPGEEQDPEPFRYEYGKPGDRVHLLDDSGHPEGALLELNQRFHVKTTVFKQKNGSLKNINVQLTELVKEKDGTYKPRDLDSQEVVTELVESTFDYENEPVKDTPSLDGLVSLGLPSFSPNLMATLGGSFRPEGPLRFGASARLVKMGTFGLAAGASSDFRSLAGTGADAFLTYQPKLGQRDLGLVLGGGVHMPIGGLARVLPTATLSFVVY